MKITKSKLKQIIQEESLKLVNEIGGKWYRDLQKYRDYGAPPKKEKEEKEEVEEHFRERIPATRPLTAPPTSSDSPIQKIEYTEEDVEKLVAALPILQKTAPMSVMLNSLKRDLKTWAAENGREDLMDLINPSPII